MKSGSTHSEETKQAISEAMTGHTVSEETSQKMSVAHMGHPVSAETRQLISEALTGRSYERIVSDETRQLISKALTGRPGRTGWNQSEETKQQIAASLVGRPKSEETKQKLSKAMQGGKGFLGPHSEETKKRMSDVHKELWKDPEFVKYISEAQHRKPNESELQLQSILDRHFPDEWKYVGDGTVWVEGRNPDFININGRKQVIEMFGIYWHDPDYFPNRPSKEELVAHYKRYGFDCLVFWEYDVWGDVSSVIEGVKTLNDSRTLN